MLAEDAQEDARAFAKDRDLVWKGRQGSAFIAIPNEQI